MSKRVNSQLVSVIMSSGGNDMSVDMVLVRNLHPGSFHSTAIYPSFEDHFSPSQGG